MAHSFPVVATLERYCASRRQLGVENANTPAKRSRESPDQTPVIATKCLVKA